MSTRFLDALLAADRPLVMEVKRRDPHGGDLLAGRAPADVVAEYTAAGAACLSVVTGKWFGGTIGLLDEVASVTSLPILQKDFITRVDHIRRAYDHGAAAVLLTAGLLPLTALGRLVEAALALGITPFVEVTTTAEVEAVPHPGDCVIAVNNKDIKRAERDPADLGRSLRLLPAVRATGTRAPVSASGIDDPATAAGLLDAGYAGLLVATSLLRAGNLTTWLADLDRARLLPLEGVP